MIMKVFPIIKKMKKLYYVICGKYRKFEKPKILYLLQKALAYSIICTKCKNENEKHVKRKNQLKN